MRKLFAGMMITFLLGFPAARWAAGQNRDQFRTASKALKARQKRERKTLRPSRRPKHSWKSARMSKANRVQASTR